MNVVRDSVSNGMVVILRIFASLSHFYAALTAQQEQIMPSLCVQLSFLIRGIHLMWRLLLLLMYCEMWCDRILSVCVSQANKRCSLSAAGFNSDSLTHIKSHRGSSDTYAYSILCISPYLPTTQSVKCVLHDDMALPGACV